MRKVLKWFGRIAVVLLVLIVGYAAYASVAYRDIPVAELDAKYGDGSKVAVVDGLPMRYRLEGHGPTLVLIHSHYFDMGMWDAWVTPLAPHFTVLRYDIAGHGLTGPDPSGRYSVDRDVTQLQALLAQLSIGPVAVVGSSLGGNIAYSFAARAPERTTALVLVNSGGLPRANRPGGRKIPAWADAVFPLVPPAALRAFLRWMIADDALMTDALQERFVAMWRREGYRAAELARLRQFEPDDADAVLAKVTAPTLILWGEQNPQLPVAMVATFRDKLTHAARVAVKTYPGAGHVLPLERPDESAADTLAFLTATRQP